MPATAIGLALILGATLSRVTVTHGVAPRLRRAQGDRGGRPAADRVLAGTMTTVTSRVLALTVATRQIALIHCSLGARHSGPAIRAVEGHREPYLCAQALESLIEITRQPASFAGS